MNPGRLLDALRWLYPYGRGEERDEAKTEQLAATRRALLEVVATSVALRWTTTTVEREGDLAALVDALAAQALGEEVEDGGRGACELLRLLLRLLEAHPDLPAFLLSSPGSPAFLLLHLIGDPQQRQQRQQPLAVRLLAYRALVKACALAPRQWQEERRRRPSSSGKRSGMALLRASLSSVGAAARGGGGEADEEEKDGFLVVRPEMTCVEGTGSEEAQEEQVRKVLFGATRRLLQGAEGEEQWRQALALAASRVLVDPMAPPRLPPTLLGPGAALPPWWLEEEEEGSEEEEEQGDRGVEAAMAALSVADPAALAFRPAVPAFVCAMQAAAGIAGGSTSNINSNGEGTEEEAAAATASYGLEEVEAHVVTALEGSVEHRAAWLALLDRRRAAGEERLESAQAAAQAERVWVWHHRWQRLLDAVAEERAIWGPGRARLRAFGAAGTGLLGVGPAAVSWVVDDVEDHLRRRRKLVRRARPGFVLPDAVGDEAARLRHADASVRMRGNGGGVVAAAAAAAAVEQQEEEGRGEGSGGGGGLRLMPAVERLLGDGGGRVERRSSREELWKDLAKYQRCVEGKGTGGDDADDEEMDDEGIDEEAMSAITAADSLDGGGRETPVPSTTSAAAGGTGAGAASASSPPPKALQASPTKSPSASATPSRPVSLALAERRRPGSASLASFPPDLLLRAAAGGKSSVILAASVSPRALAMPGGGGTGSTLVRLLSSAAGATGGGGGGGDGGSGRGGGVFLVAGVKEARPCEVICPFVVSPGLFEVHKAALRFTLQEGTAAPVPPEDATAWCLQPFPSTLWRLDELRAMYLRLYQQQQTALELFFTDQTSLLLHFHARPAALAVYKTIRKLAPRGLEPHLGTAPTKILQRMRTAKGSALTQAWQRRELSNFEYLSYLNLVAGRCVLSFDGEGWGWVGGVVALLLRTCNRKPSRHARSRMTHAPSQIHAHPPPSPPK
jgi:hypothetical protein